MQTDPIYEEKVASRRTVALFVTLTLLFMALLAWRVMNSGLGFLTIAFFCLFSFFLFYSLNYRTLIICLTPESLVLRFGIFTWRIPTVTIEQCYRDDTPLWRIGGAGIHFTMIRRRYRAMLNFLEHPRVVVSLKKRKGPVWDIAFSTRRPKEVMRLIREVMSEKRAP